MVSATARPKSEWQPDHSQLIRCFRALNESYDPVETELIPFLQTQSNVATTEQEARPRTRNLAGTIEQLRGSLFGTFLALAASKRHQAARPRTSKSLCPHVVGRACWMDEVHGDRAR
jgi:hypothetical protein